jgi:hypothetical protein
VTVRAIALGERTAYLAADAANYVRTPTTHMSYMAPWYVLDRAADLFRDQAGTLLLNVDHSIRRHWADQLPVTTETGWACTGVEPWTTFKHADKPTVHVGFLGDLDYGRTPLFDRHDRPEDVVRRLAWIGEHIGAPYRMTPGVTGCAAIRDHFAQLRATGRRSNGEHAEPYWGAKDRRESDDRRNGSGDLLWQRRAQRRDTAMPWVHAYDLNAARLSAMGVAELAWGKLRRQDLPSFDPRQAGYWAVHANEVIEPFPGAIYDKADVHAGMVWLTTPAMAFLSGLGACPVPAEAWTGTGRRLLRTIGERWNAARGAAPAGRALETVKAVYRETAGMMASPGGSLYRPDWYHTIMDRQRMTLLSHILRVKRTTGLLPLVVHTDCLWYPSEDEDAGRTADRLGLPLGSGLGKFRTHSTRPAVAFYRKARR